MLLVPYPCSLGTSLFYTCQQYPIVSTCYSPPEDFPRIPGECPHVAPSLPRSSHGSSQREHSISSVSLFFPPFIIIPLMRVLVLAFQSAFIVIWKDSFKISVYIRITWGLKCKLPGPNTYFLNQTFWEVLRCLYFHRFPRWSIQHTLWEILS